MESITRTEAQKIKMITRIGLSAIAIATIMMLSFAPANAADLSKGEKKITRQITKMIEYPESILNKETAEVMIYFQLDENGVIDIDMVQGVNEELSSYVESTLDGKVVTDHPNSSTKKYSMVISFKTI